MVKIKTILASAAIVAVGLCGAPPQPGPASAAQRKEPRPAMTSTATGQFDVKILPPASPSGAGAAGEGGGFVRLSLDKTFRGGLEAASRVEMMATSDGRSPEGGYVALERVTGKLDGRSGSFVLQHSGTMAPGSMEIHVVVSPGSGTAELAGLRGTMEIRREGKDHFYTLHYELPAPAR